LLFRAGIVEFRKSGLRIFMWAPRHITSGKGAGFTLVELLVVIGIIALLVGLIMPALNSVNANARALKCQNNIRQICQGLIVYANANRGKFPPNLSIPGPARLWYDADRMGVLLTPTPPPQQVLQGPIATCPEDTDAVRSYAMNVWCSCEINANILKPMAPAIASGSRWGYGSKNSSKLLLISETWSSGGNALSGWTAPATIGAAGDTPGQKFGSRGGLSGSTAGRYGTIYSELVYTRHDLKKRANNVTDVVGRVVIGYADCHVAIKSTQDLFNPTTGLSTLDTWWSPSDPQKNQ
jgi:prepilin-type N-terminal cleavage/methylation domain-containing protein